MAKPELQRVAAMKILTSAGTTTDLTPELWVKFHLPFPDKLNPRFERRLQESVKVDPKLLLKAKNAIKRWCRKEDQDFCAVCLIVLAGQKESRSRQLARWVAYTKSDLDHLRKIEQKHLERIPKMMVEAQMLILPKPTFGAPDNYLSRYIGELAMLIEHLQPRGRQHDIRDDALLLLVIRLRKKERLQKRCGTGSRSQWTSCESRIKNLLGATSFAFDMNESWIATIPLHGN